jgi:sn-glycerol 3-phosphate transport system ATP-binding protein
MAAIELSEVSKSFGRVRVISGLSVNIAEGEFMVLVGPSGCGKSTILRLIAGLERLSGGRIAIDGRVVNNLEPKDRNIAMVFQNYALYPHMSVYDNMAYGLKVRKTPRAEIRQKVQAAAETLGLTGLLKRKPRQLSGGQRQRVAMGRAIVRDPSVFLFDEPLSNLDAKLRNQMRVEIKRLHLKLQATSIYVTHDQVEAMTLADRIMILDAGQVEQIGPPQEIYDRPATVFTARFIGSPAMNLLPGRLNGQGDRVSLPGGGRLLLPRICKSASGDVLVGLRPEHIGPAGEDRSSEGPLLRAGVELLEPLGSDKVVHCRLDPDPGEPLVVRLPGTSSVSQGQSLELTFPGSRIHLFDKSTGNRIDLQEP